MSLETINLESMLATAPAEPAAAIVKDASPTSFVRGIPDSIRLLLSSDSHEGPETKEYCNRSESLAKVVGANWNEKLESTRATGGNCELRGYLACT